MHIIIIIIYDTMLDAGCHVKNLWTLKFYQGNFGTSVIRLLKSKTFIISLNDVIIYGIWGIACWGTRRTLDVIIIIVVFYASFYELVIFSLYFGSVYLSKNMFLDTQNQKAFHCICFTFVFGILLEHLHVFAFH